MKVTRTSILSGKTRTRQLAITDSQIRLYLQGKLPVQVIFPQLTADEREFIMTGITTEEWDETFKEIKE